MSLERGGGGERARRPRGWRPLAPEGLGVGGIEVGLCQEGDARGVEAVLAGDKLDDGAVGLRAHGVVVGDGERLEVLDQAALQVAGARGLDLGGMRRAGGSWCQQGVRGAAEGARFLAEALAQAEAAAKAEEDAHTRQGGVVSVTMRRTREGVCVAHWPHSCQTHVHLAPELTHFEVKKTATPTAHTTAYRGGRGCPQVVWCDPGLVSTSAFTVSKGSKVSFR